MLTTEIKKSPFRRQLSQERELQIKNILAQAGVNSEISSKLNDSVAMFNKIENEINGRIAGDVDDYVFQNCLIENFYSRPQNQTASYVEIGSLFGGSAIMAMYAQRKASCSSKVELIDPLDGYYVMDPLNASAKDPVTGNPITKEVLELNLSKFDFVHENVEIHQKYSTDPGLIEDFSHKSIGVLFIDGDHSYTGIKNDWEKFFPSVKEEGLIIVDNYFDINWPEVTAYCLELLEHSYNSNYQVLAVLNRTIVFKKTEVKKTSELIEKTRIISELSAKFMDISQKHEAIKADNKKFKQENKNLLADLSKTKKELKVIQKAAQKWFKIRKFISLGFR